MLDLSRRSERIDDEGLAPSRGQPPEKFFDDLEPQVLIFLVVKLEAELVRVLDVLVGVDDALGFF